MRSRGDLELQENKVAHYFPCATPTPAINRSFLQFNKLAPLIRQTQLKGNFKMKQVLLKRKRMGTRDGVVKKEEIYMEGVFFFLEFLHITGIFGEVYVGDKYIKRKCE